MPGDGGRKAANNAWNLQPPTFDPASLECATLYSEELGIKLADRHDSDLFLWFLASLLFGQRISETIARRTFAAFVRHGLTTPRRIVAAGWDYLVNPVMHEGGYVRYDASKSSMILSACRTLRDSYGGSLRRLHSVARDNCDLERRLRAFHGVGPVTVNIFLRELRPFWSKADPDPLPAVAALAQQLAIDLSRYDRKSVTFARVEAGLVRLRHRAPRAGGGRRRPRKETPQHAA